MVRWLSVLTRYYLVQSLSTSEGLEYPQSCLGLRIPHLSCIENKKPDTTPPSLTPLGFLPRWLHGHLSGPLLSSPGPNPPLMIQSSSSPANMAWRTYWCFSLLQRPSGSCGHGEGTPGRMTQPRMTGLWLFSPFCFFHSMDKAFEARQADLPPCFTS